VVDALEAIGVRLEALRVDGGLSRSDWIVQRLADLAAVPVERTARPDSTALGAAALAGLAAGVWAEPGALPAVPVELTAEPRLGEDARAELRERWRAARELVTSFRT
jgi:glycerol kinase